jgi:hypothetical protein
MSYFKWAYNTSNPTKQPRTYKIATGTAIEKGEVVKLVSGLVVAVGDTDQDDPYLGVAAEGHTGSGSGRDVGLEIQVYDHPDDVFALKPGIAITASGGSTTTFVDSSLINNAGTTITSYTDMFKGGYIQIVTCAASSALVGRKVKISAFNATNGTLTLAETLPAAIASSDTAYLCPGKLAIGSHTWNLDSNGIDINWEDTSVGEALRIFDADPETFRVFVKFRLHQNGSHPAAI